MTFIPTFPQSHIRNVEMTSREDAQALRQANHIINRLVAVAQIQAVVEAQVHLWMSRQIDLNELGNRLRHDAIPNYNRLMRRGRVDNAVYVLVRRQVDEALMVLIAEACRELSTRQMRTLIHNNDVLTRRMNRYDDQALAAYEAGGEEAIYELVLLMAERAQARREQA